MLLCASKFVTAKIKYSFKIGGTIYFAGDGKYNAVLNSLGKDPIACVYIKCKHGLSLHRKYNFYSICSF